MSRPVALIFWPMPAGCVKAARAGFQPGIFTGIDLGNWAWGNGAASVTHAAACAQAVRKQTGIRPMIVAKTFSKDKTIPVADRLVLRGHAYVHNACPSSPTAVNDLTKVFQMAVKNGCDCGVDSEDYVKGQNHPTTGQRRQAQLYGGDDHGRYVICECPACMKRRAAGQDPFTATWGRHIALVRKYKVRFAAPYPDDVARRIYHHWASERGYKGFDTSLGMVEGYARTLPYGAHQGIWGDYYDVGGSKLLSDDQIVAQVQYAVERKGTEWWAWFASLFSEGEAHEYQVSKGTRDPLSPKRCSVELQRRLKAAIAKAGTTAPAPPQPLKATLRQFEEDPNHWFRGAFWTMANAAGHLDPLQDVLAELDRQAYAEMVLGCTGNFLEHDADIRSLNLWASYHKARNPYYRRKWKAAGYSIVSHYCQNDGDFSAKYGSREQFNPYTVSFSHPEWGTEKRLNKTIAQYMRRQAQLDYMAGQAQLLWFQNDDSKYLYKRTVAAYGRHVATMHKLLNVWTIAVCVGLEMDEYWTTTAAIVARYFQVRKVWGDKTVVLHFTNRITKPKLQEILAEIRKGDPTGPVAVAWQYGWDDPVVSETRLVIDWCAPYKVDVWAGEYSRDGSVGEGYQAMVAGAKVALNGGKSSLKQWPNEGLGPDLWVEGTSPTPAPSTRYSPAECARGMRQIQQLMDTYGQDTITHLRAKL